MSVVVVVEIEIQNSFMFNLPPPFSILEIQKFKLKS